MSRAKPGPPPPAHVLEANLAFSRQARATRALRKRLLALKVDRMGDMPELPPSPPCECGPVVCVHVREKLRILGGPSIEEIGTLVIQIWAAEEETERLGNIWRAILADRLAGPADQRWDIMAVYQAARATLDAEDGST